MRQDEGGETMGADMRRRRVRREQERREER